MGVSSAIEALCPRDLPDDLSAVRARYFVATWLLTTPLCAVLAVLSVATGLWWQAGVISIVLVASAPVLSLHRRGTSLRVLTHVTMFIDTSVSLGTALTQQPMDFSSLAFLILVPLLGTFLLGPRVGFLWLVVAVLAAAGGVYAGENGWTLGDMDPAPTFGHALGLSNVLVFAWLYVRGIEGVATRAVAREREAARAKSAFLATVSHEIRTPMNGVLGMTEALLHDEAISGEQREQLLVIQRSGRVLVSLVNDVLDVSKIEAGRLELEKAHFAIAEVLADIKALHGASAEQKGLSLIVDTDAALGGVLLGDPTRLGQVLGNLVHNAIKFTERGQVRLRATQAPPNSPGRVQCRFSVDDTGPGISADSMPRLFNRFEQLDGSTTRRFGGTGLGLALSQQLVQLMGGHIEVHSQVGVGTRFEFTVAFERAAEQAPTPASESIPEVPGIGRVVLLVDDNDINLRVARRLVELCGYSVEMAKNGREAVEAVAAHSYCAVLMDCHMPEMDGFEATERIRRAHGDALPIIALTASAMPEEVAACRRCGMNDVMVKPVVLETLRTTLHRWTHRAAPSAHVA